jgi:hypothetical protein
MKDLIFQIANISTFKPNRLLAEKHGLVIQKVSWEDTARAKGSCWGPNISDMTLTVDETLMNVIRKPNFSDHTCDLPSSYFKVTIGNETETKSELKTITLKEYVKSLKDGKDLWLERDENILVSAQCCVLPCDETGEVEFVPSLYNYQSAVLVIISTSQGTTQHMMSQKDNLYFNENGVKRKFLAKRLTQDRKERGVKLEGKMSEEEEERNVILIYQIPLKKKDVYRRGGGGLPLGFQYFSSSASYGSSNGSSDGWGNYSSNASGPEKFGYAGDDRCGHRGMDDAMLRVSSRGYGNYERSEETMKRDPKYPIRVTYQFYKTTDENVLTVEDMTYIADKIQGVYDLAKTKGSLVMDRDTGRPTEINNTHVQPGTFGLKIEKPPTYDTIINRV